MPSNVPISKVAALQSEAAQVRNICVLAHVDHGKTTLSDCLVSSNGIISERLAGTVRYLDSREDEQERGITMQSSAISLVFHHEKLNKDYLVNLIDSPGHVDFSSDVSTAVRLCDGALVVVDVIEGVAIQTHAVLRQAWEERLQPCLVLNKVDRLITELRLDPVEAYEHLLKIIERVNAILQGFVSATVMDAAFQKSTSAAEAKRESSAPGKAQASPKSADDGGDAADSAESSAANAEGPDEDFGGLEFDEAQERALIFSPEKGNVVFASAVDSWAFRVGDFAPMVAEATGLPVRRVVKYLWGDYSYNAKTKTVVEQKQRLASVTTGQSSRSRPPMFATFVLASLWQVYNATVVESKPKKLEKIIGTLGLEGKVNKRDVAKGGRSALRSVMHAWLPVTRALLSMVVRCVPSPLTAQRRRVEVLWPVQQTLRAPHDIEPDLAAVRASVAACDPNGPLVAFVTKIFAVEREVLPPDTIRQLEQLAAARAALDKGRRDQPSETVSGDQAGNPPAPPSSDEAASEFFFAFARVFSGTVRPGVPLHILGPKYVPGESEINGPHHTVARAGVIPMLIMSTDLVSLDRVPAGNILALAGLDKEVLKTATVAESPICCSLSKMPSQSAPILRVSLEPVDPLQWPQLAKGLKLLNRADPVAEVRIQGNGEYILGAIGELHLERCVKDLRDRFARIELKVSKPIAIFRETVVPHSGDPDAPLPRVSPDQQFARIDIVEEEAKSAAALEALAAASEGEIGAAGPGGDPAGATHVEATGDSVKPFTPLNKRVFPGGRVVAVTAGNAVAVTVRVIPLPECVTRALEKARADLSRLLEASEDSVHGDGEGDDGGHDAASAEAAAAKSLLGRRSSSRRASATATATLRPGQSAGASTQDARADLSMDDAEEPLEDVCKRVVDALRLAFDEAGEGWGEPALKSILSLGPRGVGPNVLLNRVDRGPMRGQRSDALFGELEGSESEALDEGEQAGDFGSPLLWEEVAQGVVAGFQLACRAGPLCEEPLWGVAVVVEDVAIKEQDKETMAALRQRKQATIAGQVMSSMRETIRRGLDVHHLQHEHGVQTGCQVRIVEGVLWCMLQCHVDSLQGDQLGRMYSVLSKRRAKVISEDMWEGTSIFTVEAEIPVVESFNLGDDLRRQTSGAASTPQLVFSHWQLVPENPFFRATTEDELEEFGERGYEESYLAHNRAHKYVEQVRKRKGLATSEKVVVAAEKQRTLARKK